MLKIKTFIASVATAATLSMAPFAMAAEAVTMRLAHVFPPQSSVGEAADMFARLAAERTDGRIKITVFPSGQLGGDEAIGRQLVRGTLELAFVNPNSMVGMDSMFDFHILPFIASNYEEVDRIYYGEDNILRTTLRETIERNRMKILGYFENDFRAISNAKHPVESVESLQDLKLRVVPSQSLRLLFEKAGSQVVILPFPELFTALQQGTVDGQENGVILLHQARFFEAQKYVTLTNHSYVMSTITGSQRALNKLSDEDQALLEEIGKEVGEWQVERNRANVASALAEVKAAGIEVLEPSPEMLQDFREIALEVWEELTPVYGEERIAQLKTLVGS